MQLVLSGGQYAGNIGGFYLSRFLRLWPAFLVAFALCLVAKQQLPGSDLSLTERALILVPNFLMIFSDIPFLFHYSDATGWLFSFGSTIDVAGEHLERASMFILNGPSWSIGLEIWFYLLVPLLVRGSNFMLVFVTLLSLAVRVHLESAVPWSSYFFFPANLCFFTAGMLVYRYKDASMQAIEVLARRLEITRAARLGSFVAILALALLFCRGLIPFYRNYPILQIATLCITLSVIFESSKGLSLDRSIGELSYPIYILHAPLKDLFDLHHSPIKLTLVTCLIAWFVYRLVEKPVDNYRHRRFRKTAKQLA
jgi:peptidoglycan/LPS O-acetylase OafA/YrhL